MGIKVNLSEFESTDYEPLPPGWYTVRITDAEVRDSKSTPGAQYINWEFTVQDGEYADRRLWTNTSLQSHALFALNNLLTAVGQDTSGELEFDLEELISEELQVRAAITTYEDQQRNEVKGFRPVNKNSETEEALL